MNLTYVCTCAAILNVFTYIHMYVCIVEPIHTQIHLRMYMNEHIFLLLGRRRHLNKGNMFI